MIASGRLMKVGCEFPMIVGLEAIPVVKSITGSFVSVGVLIFFIIFPFLIILSLCSDRFYF